METFAGTEAVRELLYTMSMGSFRIIGMMTALSFLSAKVMGGALVRNGVAICLALVLYPMIDTQLRQQDLTLLGTIGISAKETMLGMLLGYMVTLVFWAISSIGAFIDNQRGATAASTLDPLSGEQESLFGQMMSRTLITLFFATGMFMAFLGVVYKSYVIWPVFSFFPSIDKELLDFLVAQFGLMMKLVVFLGSPILIAMFLSELGLGLISRFAPQLNVFFLSMSVKSAVASFLLIVFWSVLMLYFVDLLDEPGKGLEALDTIFRRAS